MQKRMLHRKMPMVNIRGQADASAFRSSLRRALWGIQLFPPETAGRRLRLAAFPPLAGPSPRVRHFSSLFHERSSPHAGLGSPLAGSTHAEPKARLVLNRRAAQALSM
jgi:hypothetical protein